MASSCALEHGVDRSKVEQLAPLGFLDSPDDPAVINDGGEIKQRAGDRRHGDPVALRDLFGVERGLVEADPRSGAPLLGDGDVDLPAALLEPP